MNSRSLSFRLVTWYAGLLTVVFVLLGALTLLILRHYLEANLLDIQARRARQIADTLLAAVPRTGEATLARQLEELYSPEANDRLIRITRSDGHVVYTSARPQHNTFDPSQVPAPALTRNREFSRKERLPDGALLVAALPYARAEGGPRYVVEVGVSNAPTESTLRQVLFMMAIGLPIAVCVAVTGGFILVRRALRPVEQLTRKAEDITQHNLTKRLPVVQTGDELQRLSVSLNNMISRLEGSIESSKQFVADASHELRTPLTVLRGELEALAQDERLRSQTRESLGSMLEEVDRLSEVVEGLLALSRLDAGESRAEWVRFDLAELAASTADQMSLLAEDKNISVLCESCADVVVEGDRARMKQVVVNLLDNAIKYTPNGGRVRLRIAREGDEAVLEIADDGIGIPEQSLPHVFKRFYRVDGSRSRDQGGAGLGLSIVESICSAHGAQVEVTSTLGEGSRFRIRQSLALNTTTHARS
ncbi:MAG TPA: ATP-binding protein [Steroidobacteraceae bacterium]|jgi:heavy metal sensor kinase